MALSEVTQAIVVYVERLDPVQQSQVLAFAQQLAAQQRRGTPGAELLAFAGGIDAHTLADLHQAITADCETVDPNEW
jgi:hypothetical protein